MSIASRAEEIAARVHGRLTQRAVIYRRGEVEIEIDATPLSLAFTVERGDGVKIREQRPHWLLLPASIDFGDGPVLPQLGDQILDRDEVHEVQGQGSGQAWEWETTARLRLKVRTVLQ